jgi:DNA-directed RNA polymerase subunit RPC12/RpoP
MPISYSCPHCGKQFNVADQYAGQTGPCAACGQTMTIPGAVSPPGYYAPQAAARGSSGGMVALIIILAVLVLMCPCGVALLLPAVQAAREAARRSSSMNNLKQIGIALHNYHDTHGQFPPAVVTDANGQPLYSGRVLLLPFMEQQAIFNAFNKNERWDSPANMALSQTVIKTFVDPSNPNQGPDSSYAFVTGTGSLFEAGQPIRIQNITDGTSNTLALIEVQSTGGSWAAPNEIDIAQLAGGLPDGSHPGGNLALFADASVRFISESIDPQMLQHLSTRAGGEPVMPP